MQQIRNLQAYIGKTIAAIDDSSCNCLTISFTDNTHVMLEAENAGPPTGLLGIGKYEVELGPCNVCGSAKHNVPSAVHVPNTALGVRTYRHLLQALPQLTDEQLDAHITVELDTSDEVFSSSNGGVRFAFADSEHQLLDENYPVFVLPEA